MTTTRRATSADRLALTRLSGELGYPTDETTLGQTLRHAMASDRHFVSVAESEQGAVVGWVHVAAVPRLTGSAFAEILALVVARDERGLGFGGALVEAAAEWATARGLSRLRVRTNVTREAAARFYAGRAFEPVKEQSVLERRLRPMEGSDAATVDQAAAVIGRLGLEPHPEGGHFREIHRSDSSVSDGERSRSAGTAIYFLLAAGQQSRWHVVASDEVWHFYDGEPIELLVFDPESELLTSTVLGADPRRGEVRVHVVPAGQWQAARPQGSYGLAGCTVSPGFDFDDFRFVADLPEHVAVFRERLTEYADLL